jgi:hypothetical protein
MAYGIGQQLDQLKGLSIQELMQRQSVDPQLVYALALQEKQKIEAAKERQAAMGMEVPQGTEVEKMEADLASRRAPGIQMAAQRSMPQPQMAQGISANPTPNMQAIGRAQGGIIGYAQGDMVEIGAKSKGPIPQMSPEENAMALKYLEGLKKFDYYDKNPDKVSPEGRQALEADRRAFEAQFPNSFRQKINEMMYGPSKGMAMGGDVKGYAGDKGSTVSSDNVAMPYMLGGKYYVDGKEISQTDYEALLSYAEELKAAQLVNRGAFDAEDRRPPRPFYAPGSQADRMFSGIRSIPSELAASLGRMGAIIGDAASTDVGRAKEALSNVTLPDVSIDASGILNSQTPQENRGGGMAPAMQQLIDSLGPQDYSVTDEERRATKEAESAAPVTSTPSDRSLNSMAGIDEQALRTALGAAMQTAEAKRNMQGAGQTPPPPPPPPPQPKEGGIRNLLAKAKPVGSKLLDIAEVLGRGAGASKGFEGAKIVEESNKIEAAQADRDARLEEQRMMLEGRKKELDARNAMAMGMSVADYAAELTDEAIAMSAEYEKIKQAKLDKAGAGFFNILTDAEERQIEAEMMGEITKIRERKLNEYKNIMAQYSGAQGQTGVSTTTEPISFADYNPTT